MSTTREHGPASDGPEEDESNPSNTWETSPPGQLPAKRNEQDGLESYERGRAYIRPAPDLGKGRAAIRLGPFEMHADGKGPLGAVSVGVAGSAALIWVSASCQLPLLAIVGLGCLPMVLAGFLILLVLLKS